MVLLGSAVPAADGANDGASKGATPGTLDEACNCGTLDGLLNRMALGSDDRALGLTDVIELKSGEGERLGSLEGSAEGGLKWEFDGRELNAILGVALRPLLGSEDGSADGVILSMIDGDKDGVKLVPIELGALLAAKGEPKEEEEGSLDRAVHAFLLGEADGVIALISTDGGTNGCMLVVVLGTLLKLLSLMADGNADTFSGLRNSFGASDGS